MASHEQQRIVSMRELASASAAKTPHQGARSTASQAVRSPEMMKRLQQRDEIANDRQLAQRHEIDTDGFDVRCAPALP